MGGIPTNYHAEVIGPVAGDPERVAPGLMAIGEAACVSVHGANRLGTNSLLDLVVFGRAAAHRATELVKPGTTHKSLAASATDASVARFDGIRNASGGSRTSEIRLAMQRIMQDNCAVFRTGAVLGEGVAKIDTVARSLSDFSTTDRSMIWNTDPSRRSSWRICCRRRS